MFVPPVDIVLDPTLKTDHLVFTWSEESKDKISGHNPSLVLPRKLLYGKHFVDAPVTNSNVAVRLIAFLLSHAWIPVSRDGKAKIFDKTSLGEVRAGSTFWAYHDLRHAHKDCFYDTKRGGWDMRGSPQIEADRIREAAFLMRANNDLDLPSLPAMLERAWAEFRIRFGIEPPPYQGTEDLS